MGTENMLAHMLFGHGLPLDDDEKERIKQFVNTFNMSNPLKKAESYVDDQQSFSE